MEGLNPPVPSPPLFRLLLWTHGRWFMAWLRRTWREAPILLAVLASLILGYLGLGYWLFHTGLNYLYHFPLFGPLLSQRVLFLVFGFFFAMLIFSNLIIGYANLFRNRETAWLLTLPVEPRRIYRWKFFEALVVSSWALIFLSTPLMLAYARVHHLGPGFLLKVAALYLPFVAMPALLGAAGTMGLARLFSSPRLKWFLLAGGTLVLLALFFGLRPVTEEEAGRHGELAYLDNLLKHTRLAVSPWAPSAWVTRAILAWTDDLSRQGLFYAALVLSNALMGMVLLFEGVGRGFHRTWLAASAARARRPLARAAARRRAAQRPSLLERALTPWRRLSPPAAALALKDVRLFWRDPAQWSQFLIFFGLLCLYVANLRNVVATFQSPFWETLISYLNLAACSLTLSTLTTRFVFPQFSLEGRRIWILGLAPFGLPRVLLQKFGFSYSITLLITASMMVVSARLLHQPATTTLFFVGAIAAMGAALCGLAVGLGAIFPNFREDNPSKIVSGFGGTVCLVLSFIFIVVFIALVALPDLLRVMGSGMGPWGLVPPVLAFALAAAFCLGPLLWAARRVKRLEI